MLQLGKLFAQWSRNPTELSIRLNDFFPLGYQQKGPYHFSTIQTIDYYFSTFRCPMVGYLVTLL